jgi:hypothetical protein
VSTAYLLDLPDIQNEDPNPLDAEGIVMVERRIVGGTVHSDCNVEFEE